jgi:hypothetical protein
VCDRGVIRQRGSDHGTTSPATQHEIEPAKIPEVHPFAVQSRRRQSYVAYAISQFQTDIFPAGRTVRGNAHGEQRDLPSDEQSRSGVAMMVTTEIRYKWHNRICYLVSHDEFLSEWEMDFIDSLDDRLSKGRDLTSAQVSKLYEIYHKIEEKVG